MTIDLLLSIAAGIFAVLGIICWFDLFIGWIVARRERFEAESEAWQHSPERKAFIEGQYKEGSMTVAELIGGPEDGARIRRSDSCPPYCRPGVYSTDYIHEYTLSEVHAGRVLYRYRLVSLDKRRKQREANERKAG